MNKKGFTLIELLAVIVILAIIALIATPIVLSIISDSKESSQIRSAEMYLKGLETSIATATLNEKNVADRTYEIVSGDVCLGTVEVASEKRTCNGEVLKIEMNGEVPTSGTVTIASGKVTDIALTYSNGKTIIKNSEDKLVYEGSETPEIEIKKFGDICTHVSGTEKTAGAKYSCEVKEGTSYNFYVLTTPAESAETINLIMDQNINSDGTPAGMTHVTKGENPSKYNAVSWMSEEDFLTLGGSQTDWDKEENINRYGPITAMKFLYNATKDWTNIAPLNYSYNDKENQGSTEITSNGIATIISLTGKEFVIGSETEPLRARMPVYSTDTTITEVKEKTNDTAYLYENLDPEAQWPPFGYWTLYSPATSMVAYLVYFEGYIQTFPLYSEAYGIRPVITLKM